MNDLEQLTQTLRRRFVVLGAMQSRSSPEALPEALLLNRLSAARQSLAPPRGRFSDARIAQGVMALRIAGLKTRYPDLKYACYGVARPMDWKGRILLGELRQLDQLLLAVRAQKASLRHFAACCCGLQSAWQCDIEKNEDLLNADDMQPGIGKLRQFLNEMRNELPDFPVPFAGLVLVKK